MKNTNQPDNFLGCILSSGRRLDETILATPDARITVAALVEKCAIVPSSLIGSRVALSAVTPIEFVETLIAWDGRVSSMLLLGGDLPHATVNKLAEAVKAEHLVLGQNWLAEEQPGNDQFDCRDAVSSTTWQLTTSGTTGMPKIVSHSFSNLIRTVKPARLDGDTAVWGLLYDPSRFAGLQVVFQALLGGGTLLLSDLHEDLAARLRFFGENGCSHLSATPSLWRKILMLPEAGGLQLRQITLGGEIADDRLLASLARRFPDARISHIYASTEVGVGFAVTDKLAGFPRSYLDRDLGGFRLLIKDDVLWIRPDAGLRAKAEHIVTDDDGFICTHDRVEVGPERVRFLGRDSSVVNVGGVKVQIEPLELLLREHEWVTDCSFVSVPNPMVGNILEVSVVPRGPVNDEVAFKKAIRAWCRQNFQAEAVPARVRVVDEIALSAAGKKMRIKQ